MDTKVVSEPGNSDCERSSRLWQGPNKGVPGEPGVWSTLRAHPAGLPAHPGSLQRLKAAGAVAAMAAGHGCCSRGAQRSACQRLPPTRPGLGEHSAPRAVCWAQAQNTFSAAPTLPTEVHHCGHREKLGSEGRNVSTEERGFLSSPPATVVTDSTFAFFTSGQPQTLFAETFGSEWKEEEGCLFLMCLESPAQAGLDQSRPSLSLAQQPLSPLFPKHGGERPMMTQQHPQQFTT